MQRFSSSSKTHLCNQNYKLILSSFDFIYDQNSICDPPAYQSHHFSLSPSKPQHFSTFSQNLVKDSTWVRKSSTFSKGNNQEPPRFSFLENKLNFQNSHSSDSYTADTEKVYNILRKFHTRVLRRCGDAGNLGYRLFSWASKQHTPSYQVYKSMIKVLRKMKQFGAFWALIDEMRRDNPHLLTCDAFIVLMRRFASSRMVAKAIQVLDKMPKYGCEPDEYVFGCLLDALFEDMRVRFKPDIKHFTSLLYGWCKLGKLMEAKFVLVQMREAGFEPDLVVYNNLLSGYAMAGKMQVAFDLISEMKRKGCEPNANSYTILIQALCGKERMDEAMLVFVEIKKCGCNADVVTYTTLISGFCKWGKIEKSYELLDSMVKEEELEECFELVKEMKKIGIDPDVGTYNTLIPLACKLGEIDESVRAWNEMEANGLSPGLDSFTIMIHGFISQNCLVEACGYFKEMVGRGLSSSPHYGTLKELLNPLLRAQKIEMAKDVLSCILGKGCDLNVPVWTILVHALFVNGHVKEACSYCLDMMDAGVMPQPDTFAKLIRGLNKLYNREIAAETTQKVRKMAEDKGMTFKMYKRRGERYLKEKLKDKTDGRKRRARKRQWGPRQGRPQAGVL
ncbi:hypothetical protein MKX01_023527 [Papaver californicum]|nr:hypothetical protein MKX01_023527 [Papaver californicum]